MNEDAFAKRRVRGDKYDRNIVYNYFHHEGVLPDFCSLVEPDKNVRVQWKRKAWLFDGHERKLQCDMKIRKGTKGELAEDFLNSETHARYIVLFIIFLKYLTPSHKYFRYMSQHPAHSISSAQVQQCKCPCIRPDIIKVLIYTLFFESMSCNFDAKECACPMCTDFSNASVHCIDELLLGDERSAQTWVDANVELGLMLQYRPQHSERSFRAAMKRC